MPPAPEWLSEWGTRSAYGWMGGAALGMLQGIAQAHHDALNDSAPDGVPKTRSARLSYHVGRSSLVSGARVGLFVAIYAAVDLGVRRVMATQPSENASLGTRKNDALSSLNRGTELWPTVTGSLLGGTVTGMLFGARRGAWKGMTQGALIGGILGTLFGGLEMALQSLQHQLKEKDPGEPNPASSESSESIGAIQTGTIAAPDRVGSIIDRLEQRLGHDRPGPSNHS